MKQIEAKIVADSISPQGHRITSMLLTYPRFIHSEVMTHRMFSRNSASSRAIPFEKMVKMVEEDPFIPIAWQKDHKGMQGTEYITNKGGDGGDLARIEVGWERAIQNAIEQAKWCNNYGLTKQLCNRLLEPFMWHTVLVTATEYDNFFDLRCPAFDYLNVATYKSRKDAIKETKATLAYDDWYKWQQMNQSQAEIHIQALAEAMWDAMNESIPKQLKAGEWHIPFGDNMNINLLKNEVVKHWERTDKNRVLAYAARFEYVREEEIQYYQIRQKIATARCARLSYMTFDGEIDYEKDIKLHDKLLQDKHRSPFEHCAMCKNDDNWYANFKGWQSYRYLIENKMY